MVRKAENSNAAAPDGAATPAPSTPWSLDHPELPQKIADKAFPHGDYAYPEAIADEKYEKRLKKLQIEFVKLQGWARDAGERIVMLFEGRDAAGKGGVIQRITQHINPRYAHVVALDKPSEVEQGQWYYQRYVPHLPHRGHMALFDRSWYNRAGVERVMGFCTEAQVKRFFEETDELEGMLVRDGIRLFKFWLTVSRAEQLKRFYERKNDPLKTWKLSPIDYKAVEKWDAYSRAIRDIMKKTDTAFAPWTVVDANDQRRARLECMKVVLSVFDYAGKDEKNIGERDKKLVMSAKVFLKRDKG